MFNITFNTVTLEIIQYYLSSPIIEYTMDWDRDKIILKIMATQKESTVNPPTILVQSKIIKAFTTNRNNPKVTIVKGKVNKTIIGLMKILRSPNTTATSIAV